MIEPRPEAILFDAGNTLVFVDAERMRGIVAAHGGEASPDRFVEVEREARLRLAGRLGEGATGHEDEVWRDYFLHLLGGLGVPSGARAAAGAAVKAEHRARHLWSHVHAGTPGALRGLREQGYRLGVISNADGRVPGLLAEVGLAEHFEFVIDSEVVGVSKPDPRIFHMATDRMRLPPERCLYVGDLYAVDVVGARGAGLSALLLDPFDHFDVDVPSLPSVAHLPEALGPRRG